mmetsp:Transcript_9661/g.9447  ORF Transcript_9661/g.9447 Transcript_9661/m.9447 type:complete len:316 (-) Transcript_9661:71-1018(-)
MLTSQLVTTGLTLGVLHVLAGPDHLSALATLSVGNSWKAMALGIRWGLGHSTGLVAVATLFISLKGALTLKEIRKFGRFCDIVLGIFMITIGFYGIVGALKTYKQKRMKRSDLGGSVLGDVDPQSSYKERDRDGESTYKERDGYMKEEYVKESSNVGLVVRSNSDPQYDSDVEGSFTDTYSKSVHDQVREHEEGFECCQVLPFIDMHDSTTQKIVSFFIGILHGVAGPGAILGVLPAVEMQSWRASTCYLGSFIVASTLSMGTFAAIYGEVTIRIGSTAVLVELILRVFSSCLSIVVGALWLILSLLGKLEGLFH